MADPSAHVSDNRLYVCPSHGRENQETFDDSGNHVQMRDYNALSFDGIERPSLSKNSGASWKCCIRVCCFQRPSACFCIVNRLVLHCKRSVFAS